MSEKVASPTFAATVSSGTGYNQGISIGPEASLKTNETLPAKTFAATEPNVNNEQSAAAASNKNALPPAHATSAASNNAKINAPSSSKPESATPRLDTDNKPVNVDSSKTDRNKDEKGKEDAKADKLKGPKTFDKENYVEAPIPATNPWKKPVIEPPKPTSTKPENKQSVNDAQADKKKSGPSTNHKMGSHRSPRPPKYSHHSKPSHHLAHSNKSDQKVVEGRAKKSPVPSKSAATSDAPSHHSSATQGNL